MTGRKMLCAALGVIAFPFAMVGVAWACSSYIGLWAGVVVPVLIVAVALGGGFVYEATQEENRMQDHAVALSSADVTRLANYNSEVARGLVHTEEYAAEMESLQRVFTRTQIAEADAKGWIVIGDRDV